MSLHFENGDVVDNRPVCDDEPPPLGPIINRDRAILRTELAEKIDKLLDETARETASNLIYGDAKNDTIRRLRPKLRALVLGENVDKPPQDWALSAGDCNDE